MPARATTISPADLLIEPIVASAACTASDGDLFGIQQVKEALQRGIRAARFGRAIPLAILLDVWAALDLRRSYVSPFRRMTPSTPIITQYDEWLASFCRNAHRCFQGLLKGRGVRGADRAIGQRDYLPLLLLAWSDRPKPDFDPAAWGQAYRKILENPDRIRRIYDGWRGPRNTAQTAWRQWWTEKPKEEPRMYVIGGMWSLFSSGSDSSQLPERFDYAACQLYLDATDPPLLPDQSRRILRLRQRRREYASVPLVSTYEDQDPHYGQTSLITLSFGRYGVFKIVNNTDPKIANPPSPLPPRRVQVHLCWVNGYKGILGEDSRGAWDKDKSKASAAKGPSTLQALVALLFDDWRSALKDLPVDFSLHCPGSDSATDYMGVGGDRWRQTAVGGLLPPARMVLRVFGRRLHTDARAEIPWRSPPTQRDWWCVCALASDLDEFGFERHESVSRYSKATELTFTAPRSRVPDCITHMIVVDAARREGTIFRVWRMMPETFGERFVELRQIAPRSLTGIDDDSSFLTLRTRAMDVVLDVLEAKMA